MILSFGESLCSRQLEERKGDRDRTYLWTMDSRLAEVPGTERETAIESVVEMLAMVLMEWYV